LWAPDNPFLGHINLKQQHDASKHCATSQPYMAQDCEKMQIFFDANEHRICISSKELAAKHFAQATSELVDRCRSAIIYDPRQLCREVRALANCFTKQFEAQPGAVASSPPLLVERRAYSDPAGHRPQQQLRLKLVRCQDRVKSWHAQGKETEETIHPDRRVPDQRND
jgi:hypothetical protein